MNALVQASSRGIGLALVRELLRRGAEHVFATHRAEAPALDALCAEFAGRVTAVRLDVTSESSVRAAASQVRRQTEHLEAVFNVAGVLHSDTLRPERRLEEIDAGGLADSFSVNAIGPALVAKHFVPLLAHGTRALLVNLSARVGSIGDNRLGGWYGYRASKAAQNMITRTLAIELARRAPEVICVALHPGTVDTDLSRPFQRSVPRTKLFSAERAAKQLLEVTGGLTRAQSGAFLDWKGEPIPW